MTAKPRLHSLRMRRIRGRKTQNDANRISPIVRCDSEDEKASFEQRKRHGRWRTQRSYKKLGEITLVGMLIIQTWLTVTRNDTSQPRNDWGKHPRDGKTKPLALILYPEGSVEIVDLRQYSVKVNTQATSTYQASGNSNDEQIVVDPECVQMFDWQNSFHPTCNSIHEISSSKMQQGGAWLVDSGMMRDIWGFRAWDNTTWALKTLRYKWEFNNYHFQSQAKDAIIADRATFSKNVAQIYGVCGATSLYEFATHGTLYDHYRRLDRGERLRAAVQITRGLADVHSLGGGKYSAFVHSDIAERQFVKLQGQFQLNDFNVGYMMRWNTTGQRTCKASKKRHININRAPEEFQEVSMIDEKIDVYSIGNIYYQLLMNERRYRSKTKEEAAALILAGDIPTLPDSMARSTDIVVVSLKTAMNMCLQKNPEERATSSQVAEYLERQLKELESQSDEEVDADWTLRKPKPLTEAE